MTVLVSKGSNQQQKVALLDEPSRAKYPARSLLGTFESYEQRF
jgi:hypothetical protein